MYNVKRAICFILNQVFASILIITACCYGVVAMEKTMDTTIDDRNAYISRLESSIHDLKTIDSVPYIIANVTACR